jgi:3',5'-cyclic AMP phosphodiesterase CpdA
MFDLAVDKINSLDPKPDVVVHTGDLTDNGVLSDYEFAVKKVRGIAPKLVVVPGNHDERNFGQSLFKEIVGPMDHKVEVEKAVIFVMNSPEPDRDEGRLGRRRQTYLEESLQRLGEDKIKVVAFHHHLIPVPYSGRETNVLEDAGDVLDTVLKHNVNLVLMGHRHVRRVLRINNTTLVNAGTVSSVRTRGRFGYSFNIIDICRDGTVQVSEQSLSEGKICPLI